MDRIPPIRTGNQKLGIRRKGWDGFQGEVRTTLSKMIKGRLLFSEGYKDYLSGQQGSPSCMTCDMTVSFNGTKVTDDDVRQVGLALGDRLPKMMVRSCGQTLSITFVRPSSVAVQVSVISDSYVNPREFD